MEKGELKTKSAAQVWEAFKTILDLKIPQETKRINEFREKNLSTRRRVNFKIDYITCDNGKEFWGDFDKGCKERGIKIHRIDPNVKSKRHVAIVERFNGTLKRGLKNRADGFKNKKKPWVDLLDDYMKIYNYSKEHRTLKAFFQRNRKPNEAPNKGDRYAPAMMLLASVEGQYIDWRKNKKRKEPINTKM